MTKEKKKKPEFPKTWVHRKTKKKFRVMPWWETVDDVLTEKDINPKEIGLQPGQKLKIGALVQVGWLLENEHGVWLGLAPEAEKEFREAK